MMSRSRGRPRSDLRRVRDRRQLFAIVKVKRLQAEGAKYEMALADVAAQERVSVRTLERWHAAHHRMAIVMLEMDAATVGVAAGLAGTVESFRMATLKMRVAVQHWNSVMKLLPPDLRKAAESSEAGIQTIIKAVAVEVAEASRCGEQARTWLERKPTRQKIGYLLRAAS